MKKEFTKRWLIGFIALLIGCFVFLSVQRYLVFKKLENGGTEFGQWTGPIAAAEFQIRKILPGNTKHDIPFSAVIFLSRPYSAIR